MSFPHLQKSKTACYFRIAIPQDLRHCFQNAAKLLATMRADKVDSRFVKIPSEIFNDTHIHELIQKNFQDRSPPCLPANWYITLPKTSFQITREGSSSLDILTELPDSHLACAHHPISQ